MKNKNITFDDIYKTYTTTGITSNGTSLTEKQMKEYFNMAQAQVTQLDNYPKVYVSGTTNRLFATRRKLNIVQLVLGVKRYAKIDNLPR